MASDELECGRVGSKRASAAADYIANEMKSYGLKPVGDKGTYPRILTSWRALSSTKSAS